GRNGPINGLIGFVSAMIWTLAAFTYWLEMSGLVHLPRPFHYQANWYAFAVQMIFMSVAFPVLRRRHPISHQNGRMFGATGGGLGLTIMVMGAGIALTQWRMHLPPPWPLVGPAIIALYGGAWFVSAVAARQKWMFLVAAGSALGVLALAALPRSDADY